MTKKYLEKKLIEEAREFLDNKLIIGDYKTGDRYLELIRPLIPRVIYMKYREMYDMKLHPDENYGK